MRAAQDNDRDRVAWCRRAGARGRRSAVFAAGQLVRCPAQPSSASGQHHLACGEPMGTVKEGTTIIVRVRVATARPLEYTGKDLVCPNPRCRAPLEEFTTQAQPAEAAG